MYYRNSSNFLESSIVKNFLKTHEFPYNFCFKLLFGFVQLLIDFIFVLGIFGLYFSERSSFELSNTTSNICLVILTEIGSQLFFIKISIVSFPLLFVVAQSLDRFRIPYQMLIDKSSSLKKFIL